MDPLLRFVSLRPRLVLVALAVLTLLAGFVLVDPRSLEPRLRIETAVEKILPTEGREKELYDRFRERFGNDEFLFVGMITEDVFRPETLRRIQRITSRIADLPEVERVISLSNAPDVRSEDGDISVRSVFDEVPTDPAELSALRARVLANPVHVGRVISDDGDSTAFLVQPRPMSEAEFRSRDVDRRVEEIAREEAPDDRIVIAGTPPLKAATSRILLYDLFRIVPLGYLFMAIVAFGVFRSLRGVVIPLGVITLAQIWTLAVIVASGRSLNLVTFIVPPLINAVGFAYAIHVVSEHDELRGRGRSGPQAALEAMRQVAFPIVLTALTTAAGFLSLMLSPLLAIREFGAFCVVGVLTSLVAAFTLAPATLALWPVGAAGADTSRRANRFEAWATRLGRFDVRHASWILAAGALVAALAVVGVLRMQLSTSFTSNLHPEHPLRQAIGAFDQHLAGSISLHVVLEAEEAEAFKEPERLATLLELQQWLDAQPEVTDTTSLVDYLRVVNRAFHDGDAEAYVIPGTKRLISQYLFFLWNDQLESLVSPDFRAAAVLARIPARPSDYTAALLDRIEARLAEMPVTAYVTGDTVRIVRTIDAIAWGQALSLSGATLIIYAILLAYFRSFRVAFLALIPNVLPVLVYFGVLGLSGVTLNVITSLIACIVLGIAVDDTIHLMVRFRERERELGGSAQATVHALRDVARPVTSTTASLCAAFMVLAFSGLRHQVEFGVLATAMLAFAWLVDVTFTPALLSRIHLRSRRSAHPGEREPKSVLRA